MWAMTHAIRSRLLHGIVSLLVSPEFPHDPAEHVRVVAAVRSPQGVANPAFATYSATVTSAPTVIQSFCVYGAALRGGDPRHPAYLPLKSCAYPSTPGVYDHDLSLLRGVQRYLAQLRNNQVPAAVLADAWEQFYQHYNPVIHRAVVESPLPNIELDDCIQEVWAELSAKLAQFEYDAARGTLRSWMQTVIRRKAMDYHRRTERFRRRRAEIDLAASPCSRSVEPATAVERSELCESVWTALADFRSRVSTTSFLVLYHCSFDGRNATEVAELLGLKPEQIWYRHHRVKRQFAAYLRSRPRFNKSLCQFGKSL
jgi:RNA polymerase sigma factor (sigma-70 family)